MKVLQINTVYGQGSTGRIAQSLHDACLERGIDCLCAHRCASALPDSVAISSKWDSRIHGWWARLTMFKGTGSFWKTLKFLKKVKKYHPDVIHLHNLHGSYVNLPLLFRYIKKHRVAVVWTLHDCWAFTAICSHFAMAGCDQWKYGCRRCPQRKALSASPLELTKGVWRAKRRWFTGVPKLAVVTPSRWLADLTRASFLKEYPVKIINNGIDLGVFTPVEGDFREKNGLLGKKLILGVAFDWGPRKGLDVFAALAARLPADYQILLVGTDDTVDARLPENVMTVHRTADQRELAVIYTAADVFVNPTREDTYPTVNMEALACGTPVITFRTGGSPEIIDETCGCVVESEDVDALERQILRVCRERPYSPEACLKRAKMFDRNDRFREYIHLYEEMV